jgi:hypothetical protein
MNQIEEHIPDQNDTPDYESPTPAEVISWLEFGCWTMVALAPFLYWVNGPAVSTDQFIVRTALVSLALTGGTTIRLVKWVKKRRKL